MSGVSRKDSFFGFHADFHAHQDDVCIGKNVTQESIERFLEAVRPDYVQVDCKGHFGYSCYPTKIGAAPVDLKKDLISLWRKATKKYRVALVIHYSGLVDKAATDSHPEWAAVKADGKSDPFCTSTFGPYVDELMIPQLKELITDYDVDGAWIDGECWGAVLDYSKRALEEFRDMTGIKSVPKSKADPYWREFIEFHRDRFRDYVKHYVDELHKFKPEFQVTSNLMFSPWMPEPVSIPLDFLSGDYKPEDGVDLARLGGRYMPAVGLPWDIMTWGNTKGKDQYNISLRPTVQLKQEAASVIAQGGGWQFVAPLARSGCLDEGTIEVTADIAQFCRQRQELCHRTSSVPQAAMLLPAKNMYDNLDVMFYFADEFRPSIMGPLHCLLDSGYSVDVRAEYQLTGNMDKYPVIVVPECNVLAEDFVQELKDYVHKGGSLLLCGPEVASMFKDELGVCFDGEIVDMDEVYEKFKTTVVRDEWTILEPGLPQMYITHKGIAAACPGAYQKVTPQNAEPINYCYFTRDLKGEKICASSIVRCEWGLIGAIYVSLTKNYYQSHMPILRDAFGGIMQKIFPEPMVSIKGPKCVDVSIKTKDDMLLIHLVNMSGLELSDNYAARDHVLPVVDVEIEIRLDSEPSSVEWAYGTKIKFENYKEGVLKVVLDKLEIHDTLVIKLGDSQF